MKKTGIFGGTFDPLHNGHINFAEKMSRLTGVDKTLVIPTGTPPYKKGFSVSPARLRLDICKNAFERLGKTYEVSDIEVSREGKSYTVDTVRKLREMFPDTAFYLFIGSDKLLTFDRWYGWKSLLSMVTLCIAVRPGDKPCDVYRKAEKLRRFGGKVKIFDIDAPDISSAKLRERIRLGDSIKCFVPECADSVIKENRMYYDEYTEIRRLLREKLTEKRYLHSEAVAKRAEELSKKHGFDENFTKKAFLAGLVHDICKNMPEEEQYALAKSGLADVSDEELSSPALYHSKAGAAYAKNLLGVDDEDMINAIRYHTEGRAGMSDLEKLIYIADLTSSDRDYGNVSEMRELADKDIDAAMRESLIFIKGDLLKRCGRVSENTLAAYREYVGED